MCQLSSFWPHRIWRSEWTHVKRQSHYFRYFDMQWDAQHIMPCTIHCFSWYSIRKTMCGAFAVMQEVQLDATTTRCAVVLVDACGTLSWRTHINLVIPWPLTEAKMGPWTIGWSFPPSQTGIVVINCFCEMCIYLGSKFTFLVVWLRSCPTLSMLEFMDFA